MANTTYMKNQVEDWVRNWLDQQYPGSHFKKDTLKLTTGGNHEFDAVSQENSIIAGITGHSWKTKGGNLPSAKYDGLYRELYFLSLIRATKKLLVLTNEDMYRDFVNRSKGKVAQGIEISFCQLPVEMRQKVAQVQQKASEEQKA